MFQTEATPHRSHSGRIHRRSSSNDAAADRTNDVNPVAITKGTSSVASAPTKLTPAEESEHFI